MKRNLLLLMSTASLLLLSACGGGRMPSSRNPYAVNTPKSVNSLPTDRYSPRITGHTSNENTKKALPKYKSTGIHEDIWKDQDQTANNNQPQTQSPVTNQNTQNTTPKQTPAPTVTQSASDNNNHITDNKNNLDKPTANEAQRIYNQEPPLVGSTRTLHKVDYTHIPGWNMDSVRKAIPGLLLSCRKIISNPRKDILLNTNTGVGGTPRDWQNVCNALENIKTVSNKRLREFMEKGFSPYKVQSKGYTQHMWDIRCKRP